MNLATTLLVGAVVHALIGSGIFFAKEEPHRVQIFIATTLKGMLVALLSGFSLNASSGLWIGAIFGVIYGFSFGIVVFLAKGANFKATPHLIGGSIIQGGITGALIARLAFG
jgi:hypothetical protein